MKNLLPFVLIAIFLYNQVGYFVAFKIRQYEVRREIKAKIKSSVPPSELTVIRIVKGKENGLQWIKEHKEFTYNGNMYDVVRKEITEGTIVYHCINDVQEKQLFTDLDEHVRNHMNDHHPDGKQPIKTATKDYFVEGIVIPSAGNSISFVQFPLIEEAVPCRFTPPPALPPELS